MVSCRIISIPPLENSFSYSKNPNSSIIPNDGDCIESPGEDFAQVVHDNIGAVLAQICRIALAAYADHQAEASSSAGLNSCSYVMYSAKLAS